MEPLAKEVREGAGVPRFDRKVARDGKLVLSLLGVLAAALALAALHHVSFAPSNVQRADAFDTIVLRQGGGGQLSFEVGIALRQAAGTKLRDLTIPNRRHVVKELPWKRSVLSEQILRLLLRGRVTVAGYDPRIDEPKREAMLATHQLREVGRFGPVIIVQGSPAARYVLRSAADMGACYIVPEDVNAQLGPWTGEPLPPDEGLPPEDAEIP